ncbi:Zinc finger CCCH domain-containing protein 44 [Apostasia shenzhenica]|uniref:Zinc finger CCCH domain-containing protein 44 n=1 Tax=Apostasia shenzhenica TaxID=1088818 RepID=A0A2I0AAA9_9ASPA|nr:Zinc finger CCCH domain-containing protein 44 [Apostasia shenzhenica]
MEPAESPRLRRRDRGGAFGGANLLGTSPEELELSEEKTSFGNLGPGQNISSFPRLGLGALRGRDGMRGKRQPIDKDELSEDYCFVCKDGGDIRVCDFKNCLKSYHPDCVNKDDSFLESNERWTCGWHSCYNCSRSSSFKCYCCPYSSCRTCIEKAEFVQVKGAKGFCTNCLRLAKLIEENCDVNSDGEKVDFNDTETYEFLFKDYWAILNEKEGLTLDHVRSAYTHLKSGEKFNDLSDSDEPFEQQPDAQLSEVDCEAESSPSKHLKRKHKMIGAITEKSKSRKKTYIGWASKELIEFLSYMGRDTKQALGQHDVYEIVKNYIQTNNLLRFDKKKKKHVFCDATLHSLFRRKKINFFKVYSLLESHFSANVDTEDESLSFGEDDYSQHSKWQRQEKGDSRSKIEKKHFVEHALDRKNCFAAIIEDNIKTIYLKRSLIVELMADLQTFEMKVLGCFVRRKNDPKDFYGTPQKMHQLDQITGVKKVAEAYKLGDMTMDIVLRVSNYWKDVKISMLSDDGFEEDECEDLRQLVKKGLFKRPVIVSLYMS